MAFRSRTSYYPCAPRARIAFETLKARLTSAPLLLILKSGTDAEFIVATDASDVGLGAVLLQEDSEGEVRPCAYWARKLKDTKRKYNAYDLEALVVVEAVTRVWRMHLDGAKAIQVVTNHSTLTQLLKQSSTNLSKRQAHFVENEADAVYRIHDYSIQERQSKRG